MESRIAVVTLLVAHRVLSFYSRSTLKGRCTCSSSSHLLASSNTTAYHLVQVSEMDPTMTSPHASGATLQVQQTAAHRVLHCDELLRMIVRFVLPPEKNRHQGAEREAKATLASLAVVSSALSEPALNELWTGLGPNVGPLKALCDANSAVQVPTPEQSPRLFKYTSCIRNLILMSGSVPKSLLDPSLHVMFPRLRELHWNVYHNPFVQPFSQFIVPGLETLMIDIDLPIDPDWEPTPGERVVDVLEDTVADAMFAVEARCATTLTDLRLYWANIPIEFRAEEIFNVIPSLTRLQSLYLDVRILAGSDTALCQLSALPVLKTLEIVHPGHLDIDSDLSHLQPAPGGFRALEELTLELTTKHVWRIFQLINIPKCKLNLRSCKVVLIGNAPERAQQGLAAYVMLAVRRPRASVFLDFSNHDVFNSHPGSVIRPVSQLVFPSLARIDLVDLRLRLVAPGTLTDALCAPLATAWPRLRTLHLLPDHSVKVEAGSSTASGPGSTLTLRGLRLFAERCRDLWDVIITLDASGEHWMNESLSLRQLASPRPVMLRLGMSPVTSAVAVAVYLRRCFSSIKILDIGVDSQLKLLTNMKSPFEAEWKRLRALVLRRPKPSNSRVSL